MTEEQLLKVILERAENDKYKFNADLYVDAFSCIKFIGEREKEPDRDRNHALMALVNTRLREAVERGNHEFAQKMYELYRTCLFYTAPYCLDDFARAIEFDRPNERKFYAPRRHYLKPMVEGYQAILDGKLRLLTVSMPKRAGKAVTLDTELVTPTGTIRMGDVSVGTVLIGADGKPTKVTDVFPQGKVPVYEVRFTDGAKVKTCGNHLWTVKFQNVNAPSGYNGYSTKVISTEEMYRFGVKGGKDCHSVFSVKYTEPVEYEHKDVSIDPYLLGVLLGDGSLTESTIVLTCYDPEIIDRFRDNLPPNTEVYCQDANRGRYLFRKAEYENQMPSGLCVALKNYNLMGKRAYDKHIPVEYLYNDSETRWEMLRGLLDTDGCCSSRHIEFATTSKQLRDDVMFLVRSLGGKCCFKERMGRYKKNGKVIETRPNYRVHIQFPKGVKPFNLGRKAEVYKPKRESLYHYVDEIIPCGEELAQCVCVDNEEHLFLLADHFVPTHNSQTEILFTLLLSGRFPNRSSLMEGTGDDLVRSFYNGCLEYLVTPNEYSYYEIFPNIKLSQTNADLKTINLNRKSRFPTIMCRSIDSRQVGLSEATNALLLDDCVEGREEAKNRQRLDDKWEVISGDIMGRAIEGTPMVFTGTRYSIYDPIGRIQEYANEHKWNWRAIEIPALDFRTDESNYEHIREGRRVFTTAYFREQRDLLSQEQFESEFQQQPFEAHGLLFPKDELNYYYQLPREQPDAIFAVCDTAESGADSVAMPVAYIFGDKVYIHAVVFDNSPPEVTKPECAACLIKHNVAAATFESNNAGMYYARDVADICIKKGFHINIRAKRTQTNKRTKIEFASDNIKKFFYFKAPTMYKRGSQYWAFMRELTTYTRTGKVPHDDAPDALAMLENELRMRISPTVEVFPRPF